MMEITINYPEGGVKTMKFKEDLPQLIQAPHQKIILPQEMKFGQMVRCMAVNEGSFTIELQDEDVILEDIVPLNKKTKRCTFVTKGIKSTQRGDMITLVYFGRKYGIREFRITEMLGFFEAIEQSTIRAYKQSRYDEKFFKTIKKLKRFVDEKHAAVK